MVSWLLVFWLQVPENHTVYTTYTSEMECKNAAQVWNTRLRAVKSQMISECRKKETQ